MTEMHMDEELPHPFYCLFSDLKLSCCAAFHLPPADAPAVPATRSQPREAPETPGNVGETAGSLQVIGSLLKQPIAHRFPVGKPSPPLIETALGAEVTAGC